MSVFTRFKKILTWTIMSTAVLALTVTSIASGNEDRAFGFKLVKAQQQTKVLERQLACLARNVFYEANGEPMAGQMAVAQVTVNRARSGLFPKDLCAVVSQSTVVGSNTRVCQFSWYCNSDLNKARVIKSSESSYIAAKKVFLEGQKVAYIDKDVMWFHEDSIKINPRWPHRVVTKIGNHVFYTRQK